MADELEVQLPRLEQDVVDVSLGDGLPPGFHPERHLAPGVPRIRPLLVLLASGAAGQPERRTDEVAVSAELLHLALVVHDTALGRQGGRRRRIARRLLGGAAHWLGGNHLSLRALEVARHAPTPEILGEVLDTLREISEGQALGQLLRDRDADEAEFVEYAAAHAGAVFSFCTRAGGRLAGASRPVVSALGRYGRHMGIGWHALEDLWTFQQDEPALLGSLARAAAVGRPVLPLVVARAARPEVGVLLDRALARGDLAACARVRDEVSAAGGLVHTRKVVLEESLTARRALRSLPPSPHREALDRIARSLALSASERA